MILLYLFLRFASVGLFSVGGGLATLPFLYEMSSDTGWFTTGDISNMIAVSESTPGPLGINMSTYVGYITAGIPGAVTGPLGLITPSVVVITVIFYFLERFKENKTVQNVFYGLRPASAALIAAAGLSILKLAFIGSNFDTGVFTSRSFIVSVIMAALIYAGVKKTKLHPIVFIALSAAAGVIFGINTV